MGDAHRATGDDWRLVPRNTLLTIYPAGGATRADRARTTASPVPAGSGRKAPLCVDVGAREVPMVVEQRPIVL